MVYVNQVGGNDELVFDGASFVMLPGEGAASAGSMPLQLPSCRESVAVWDAKAGESSPLASTASPIPVEEELFRALVLGVRDYAGKCGFQQTLLGLSGGIDSALVAVIAAAALGGDRVQGLLMPSLEFAGVDRRRSSSRQPPGTEHQTLPIAPLMQSYDAALTPALAGPPADVTAENLQSRIRGPC